MADTVEPSSARNPKERIVRLLNEGILDPVFHEAFDEYFGENVDIQNLYEESDVPVSDTDGEDSDGK